VVERSWGETVREARKSNPGGNVGSNKGLWFEATGPAYLRVWGSSFLEVGTERPIRYGHMPLEIKRLGILVCSEHLAVPEVNDGAVCVIVVIALELRPNE
jgi:hypothetical protein